MSAAFEVYNLHTMLHAGTYMEGFMQTIKQLLEHKGSLVWSIKPDDSVYKAIELMAEKGIGALVVMQQGILIGILSERDYARKVILQGRSSKETLVKEIMSEHVIYTDPESSIEACMGLMTENRIRHLPVMDEGRLIGLISIGDLVRSTIAEQQYLIEQLENYISG